jgi:general stress protein 26
MERDDIQARARQIIDKAVNGILSTVDENGFPHPRTMWTAGLDDDFTVYFVTGRSLLKCRQIQANPRVSVFWTQTENETIGWNYAFLKAHATISDDQALRDRFWNDVLKEYFPTGSTDPEYVVLVLKPVELMVMDSHKYPLDKVEF